MSTREFAVGIEVVQAVDRDDWDLPEEVLREILDRVALNAIGAILEHNPDFEVKRLRSFGVSGWARHSDGGEHG